MRTFAPLLGITLLSLALPDQLQAQARTRVGSGIKVDVTIPAPPRPRPSQAFVAGNAGGIVPVSMNGAKGPLLPGRVVSSSVDP